MASKFSLPYIVTMWPDATKLMSALANKAEQDKAEAERKLHEQLTELRKFSESSEIELKKALNWNQFGDGVARLRRSLGMGDGVPNVIVYGAVFVAVLICQAFFSQRPHISLL